MSRTTECRARRWEESVWAVKGVKAEGNRLEASAIVTTAKRLLVNV